MTDPINDFSHPATKVASCMAVTGSLQGVSLDAPDFLLVRARDLKHVLQALDAALHLRADGRSAWASRALHTERTATGQLRNISNSSKSLQDFLVSHFELLEEAGVRATRGPACGDTAPAAGADFSVHPDGNNGDNQPQPTDKAV